MEQTSRPNGTTARTRFASSRPAMANEDLLGLEEHELGHLRRLVLSSGMVDVEDRLIAIDQAMANLGYWRCDHCEVVTPLPNCYTCGRLASDQPSVPTVSE